MVNGWVIIDKPLGMSSAHVVAKIRKLFKTKKVGHGGTLDPLATGVLPIALGEATKTVSYVLEGNKSYSFEVKWGESRSTDDAEGEVLKSSSKMPTDQEIQDIIPRFLGEIEQVPPAYSAIKVDGKRAYALARGGAEVKLAARKVTISELKLVQSHRDSAKFEVKCSKGTYVRSLARDLAEGLGTCGYISSLRRLSAGPFLEKNAILLDSLLKIGHKAELMKYVLPLQDALADILALEVQDTEAAKLCQGQTISYSHEGDEEVVLVLSKKKPLALAKLEQGQIKPIRVFNI